MPQQSISAIKVAFGVRAQYATILALSLLMVTQIIGVAIFSGKAQATASLSFTRSIPSTTTRPGYMIDGDNFDNAVGVAESPDHVLYVTDNHNNRLQKFNLDGSYIGSLTLTGTTFGGVTNVAIAPSGDIYIIGDLSSSATVAQYSSSGAYIRTITTSGSSTAYRDIKVDSSNNLYVIGGAGLRKYSSGGSLLDSWTTGGSPRHLAVSDGAYVYYNASSTTVKRLNTTTDEEITWGSAGTGVLQFVNADGIALDSGGNVYVVDVGRPLIKKFSANGNWINSADIAEGGDSVVNWFAYNNSFSSLFIGSNGKKYLNDKNNNRIEIINTDGTYSGEIRDSFSKPGAMAIGTSGAMYVVDKGNNRVKKINKTTGEVLADWGSYGALQGSFKFYSQQDGYSFGAIAVDANENIYVADDNQYVRKFNKTGVPQDAFGEAGSGDNQFGDISGLAIDINNQKLYVLDKGNGRIQKSNTSGSARSYIGSPGTGNGQFTNPNSITVGANGLVYVGDRPDSIARVQVFDTSGNFLRKFYPYGADGSTPHITGLAVDARGSLLVGEASSTSLRKFPAGNTSNGSYISSHGMITYGGADGQVESIDGLLTDTKGNIFIAGVFGRIQTFHDPDGEPFNVATNAATYTDEQTSATLNATTSDKGMLKNAAYSFEYGTTTSYSSGTFAGALPNWVYSGMFAEICNCFRELAVDNDDNVYITDGHDGQTGHTIIKYNSSGTQVASWDAFVGNGNNPNIVTNTGLHTDAADNLYVVDYQSGHIQKFSSTGSLLLEFGSSGSGNGQLNGAWDLTVDNSGNIYVVDYGNNRIQKFNSSGIYQTQWPATGSGAGQFEMHYNTSIATDSNGYVYVTDYLNCRINKFNSSGVYQTQWGDCNDLPSPTGVAVDVQDRIYALTYGEKIRQYSTSGDLLDEYIDLGSGFSYGLIYGTGDIEVGGSGTAYVANSYLGNIQKFNFETVSASLTGLTCATTYHYRAKGVVDGYTVYGQDQQFTTSACDAPDPFAIVTGTLPDGAVGTEYNQTIATENATGPVLFAVQGDQGYEIPPGLNLDTNTGVLYGTPTVAGTYQMKVIASTDDFSGNPPGTINKIYDITIAPEEVTCDLQVTATNTNMPPEAFYSDQVQVTGNVGSPVFSLYSGEFPPGISMDGGGSIYGIPNISSAGNSYSPVVRAQEGDCSAYGYIDMHVNSVPTIHFTSTSLPSGQVDETYHDGLGGLVSDGFGQRAFTLLSGDLPPGLALTIDGDFVNPDTGENPSIPTTAGTYTFTVQVADLTGSDTAEFTIQIDPALPPAPPRTNTPLVTITSPANDTAFDITHDSVTVTGTGPANRTITIYMDNYQLGTTTADGDGNWTYTVNTIFPGSHSFDAKWIPAGDLAFVPYFDPQASSSNIGIMDGATGQLLTTFYLPDFAGAMSAEVNHAGTKVYVVGLDMESYSPAVWEYDIASGIITRQLTASNSYVYYAGITISGDDHFLYASLYDPSGGGSGNENPPAVYHKIDLATMTIAASLPPVTQATPTDDTLYTIVSPATHGNSLYSPASLAAESDPYTVSSIDTVNESISSISTINEARWPIFSSQVSTAGDTLYVAVNNKLALINAQTNTKINDITIAGMATDLNQVDDIFTALAVDAVHQKAYIATYMRKLYIVDLATEQSSSLEISPDDAPNDQNPMMNIQLNSDATRLYIPDLVYGKMRILDTGTNELEAPVDQVIPQESQGYALGRFISRTTAPQANVNFSVAQGDVAPPVKPPAELPPGDPIIEEPVISNATPAPGTTPATATRAPKTTPITAQSNVSTSQNSLFALAKRIPEPFAIGFPWFLLTLALGLVVIQYYQVHSESTSTKRMQINVANQGRLVEEQNNFVALSTHYLHTPLTVMEGEITLMVRAGTISQEQATKLKATLASLSAEAEATLAQEEQNELNA